MNPFAFVFPGQGSQAVGMYSPWLEVAQARQVLEEASDALGEDLGRLVADGPKNVIDLTTNTQPAMLVSGVMSWAAWQAAGGGAPSVMAGHSLGEYSALVASGVLGLADAVRVVRFRAEAMQRAVPVGQGAMAAILGLAAPRVIEICADASTQSAEVVEAVNFNDPAQTVIAGTRAAVEMACEMLKAGGAKRALSLPVSAPFHSRLMKSAADELRARLAEADIKPPTCPVINNVDVAMPTGEDEIRDALYRQAYAPVRWVETVQAMRRMGVAAVAECGAGKVLGGLAKRIDPELTVVAINDPGTLAAALEALETRT